jgi:small-conductance mechanosensitive channel
MTPIVEVELLRRSIQALVLLVVGLPLVIMAGRSTQRWVSRKYSRQQGMVAGKAVFYPGLLILIMTLLAQLDFSLAPLLGAAGIVGIAIGFASQTSVSNVISGFFLIAEKPFAVDDVIQVGDTVGRVLSIDTLSVKLRTLDNRFVRIPNETIVKSQVTTITRYPIRRVELDIGVAYKENIARVREVILQVVENNPRALMEPAPMLVFDSYGDSALELKLRVWATRENFIVLKNALLEEIKVRFDQEGIEIPFPHRSLYAGEASAPFPVRVVADARDEGADEGAEKRAEERADEGAEETAGPEPSGGG